MLLEVMGVDAGRFPGPIAEEVLSQRGRLLVLKARAEAGRMGSSIIEPEHLLLAMLDQGGQLGGLLARKGVSETDVEALLRI